jgi:hypothetical protein
MLREERGGCLRRILYEERDCDGTVKKRGGGRGAVNFDRFHLQSAWHAAEISQPIFHQGFVDLYDWLRLFWYF